LKLPRTGEAELADSRQLMKTGGVPFGSRRYRHTKLTAPDPNSKNFERKERKRQKALKAGESVPDFPKNNRKGVRSELKTGHQIQKQRKEKEKRRQKTGRHFLAKNKKKK
jgi:ATP-dependent RNA helicase DDX54/DBP10